MLIINPKTTNRNEFLEYLCQKADLCAFHLPMFLCRKDKDKEKYRQSLEPLIKGIEPYIVSHYWSCQYIGLDYGDKTEIFVFKSNDFFTEYLKEQGSLDKWRYPDLPEDLCFLNSAGKCWLKTTTHEDECYFFDESNKEIRLMERWGIHFVLLDETMAWRPSFLESPEVIQKMKLKMKRKKQDVRLRGEYTLERLKPIFEANHFVQKDNTFIKISPDWIAVIVQIEMEYEDVTIMYDAFPLSSYLYMKFQRDLMLEVDLCEIEGDSDKECIDVFENTTLKDLLSLKTANDVWDYHLEKSKLYNLEDVRYIDDEIVYCLLSMGEYNQAQKYIKIVCENQMCDRKSKRELSKIACFLKSQKYDKLNKLLFKHIEYSIRCIEKWYGVAIPDCKIYK